MDYYTRILFRLLFWFASVSLLAAALLDCPFMHTHTLGISFVSWFPFLIRTQGKLYYSSCPSSIIRTLHDLFKGLIPEDNYIFLLKKHIICLAEWQRKREWEISIQWSTAMGLSKPKSGTCNSIFISQKSGSDPCSWANICCFLGCNSFSVARLAVEQLELNQHSNGGL